MEPTCPGVRPIHVRSRLKAVVVLGCLVVLAGCGSAPTPSAKSFESQRPSASPSVSPSASPSVSASGDCASDSVAFAQAKGTGDVDVDGDGKADAVKVTTGSQECPTRLIAHVASGYVGGELAGDDPAPAKVFGIELAGHQGDLLVTQQDHPRGGYQLHVFANGPDGLAELKDGDRPLVPFVATDTRPISYAVDCQGASIVVRQAVAAAGGTWSLRRTTYAVTGTAATRTSSKVVAERLTPKAADQQMPAGQPFAGCRVS